ncbi:hypothetical protein N7501_001267 [Penicillium viridicatum]|nr:hypothetical protein N7501_001267 [Penicillium viridicatum]
MYNCTWVKERPDIMMRGKTGAIRYSMVQDLQCEQPDFNRIPLSNSLPGLRCGDVSHGGAV